MPGGFRKWEVFWVHGKFKISLSGQSDGLALLAQPRAQDRPVSKLCHKSLELSLAAMPRKGYAPNRNQLRRRLDRIARAPVDYLTLRAGESDVRLWGLICVYWLGVTVANPLEVLCPPRQNLTTGNLQASYNSERASEFGYFVGTEVHFSCHQLHLAVQGRTKERCVADSASPNSSIGVWQALDANSSDPICTGRRDHIVCCCS